MNKDLIIIGGGPAGLAAALEAKRRGIDDILIIERDAELGGILGQCIHAGFGLHMFGEELTGPEYATRFIREVNDAGIEYLLNSMVLSLTADRVVTYISPSAGLVSVGAEAVVLAMGCRERTRGALNIPGSRPAGILTAGAAQRFVNIEGYMPGREVVILGSGDIGLIMARRMTLEGAKVKMVCELMPYSNGLARNINQCLYDFDIPLLLSHTITGISGADRLESVTVSKVDENRRPIPGSEFVVPCDTLLLSVGLIPENEAAQNAGIAFDPVTGGAVVDDSLMGGDGIFACGNVLHVHDLVDFVTGEGYKAGRNAAEYIKAKKAGAASPAAPEFSIADANAPGSAGSSADSFADNSFPDRFAHTKASSGVRYIVPQRVDTARLAAGDRFFFRVDNIYKNCVLNISIDGKVVRSQKKQKVMPSEMESFTADEDFIAKVRGAGVIGVEVAVR